MSLVASASHIRSAFERILLPEQVVELRALHVPTDRGPRTLSGFFDDHDALAKAAAELSDMGAGGVYFTPNPLKPTVTGTVTNRAEVATRGSLTKDVDVLGSRWLLIDIDPERPANCNATDEEKSQGAALAKAMGTFLRKRGWPDPLFGSSGNGYHLMYLVEDADPELLRRILAVLGFLFDNDWAKVDQKVFNPGRIWKMYGTVARKGEETEDRPHRRALLLSKEPVTGAVSHEQLDEVAALLPDSGTKTAGAPTGALDTYVTDHFPKAVGPTPWQGTGRRWVFDVCPWDDSHTDRSAYIIQFSDGGIAAGCLHKTCKGAEKDSKGRPKGWKALQTKAGTPFGGAPALTPTQIRVSSATAPNLTDLGNARRMVAAFQHELVFCVTYRQWYLYNGKRWKQDADGAIHRRAKAAVAGIFAAAASTTDTQKQQRLLKHALKSESARALQAMVTLASTEQGVAVTSTRLDRDLWLFNVQNGTLDLRSGVLSMHDRSDYITKISPVEWDSTAECPHWDAFLDYAMKGDQEVIAFVHRFFGYCLTGLTTEQVLLFMEGTGQNGKTTALLILMYIMGDYAIQGAPGLLMAKRGESHPTEVADLEGVRFVANSEVEKGKPFAEVLIKQLTGSDRIRARKMRQDFYEFDPTHKLIIAANHRPIIKGNDEGIWRRVLRLPWERKIEDKDPMFLDKLKAEAPGILRKLR
jgi:P4 family phage/plasmid primase-like protien